MRSSAAKSVSLDHRLQRLGAYGARCQVAHDYRSLGFMAAFPSLIVRRVGPTLSDAAGLSRRCPDECHLSFSAWSFSFTKYFPSLKQKAKRQVKMARLLALYRLVHSSPRCLRKCWLWLGKDKPRSLSVIVNTWGLFLFFFSREVCQKKDRL